ncbi:MAG: CBS domain-containing protein [Candidatus Faecousia sp.]|nr:CBS domain-containing protein [Clostridiales bacterium]MDY4490154.1 CBS domain-containing protein [Candidatus Faecousia sp.]MDY6181720.1 CBS domain-containing protein [Candidatus Faecousia sp.]
MNNILFFLTPKAMCSYLYDDYTMRQALEKMEATGFAALPILNRRGEYRGTLTEGDLLWGIKNMCYMDMRQAEARKIMEISRRKDNVPVRVTTSMHDLVERASHQNFVPVVDDKNAFIGIITRRAIIQYCQETLFPGD